MRMMHKEEVVELAKSYAEKGFLCSESVLLAISNMLEIRCELIPRIATGFGAGIGGCGSVCGAVSGGVMALGLKFGRNEPEKREVRPYWFALELVKRFEREFEHSTCRELTACDFLTLEGRKKYGDERLWETKCRQLIASATAIVFDIISENASQTGKASLL